MSRNLANENFKDDKRPLQHSINTTEIRSVRKLMLQGKKVKGCEACYQDEAKGGRSLRQEANEKWLKKPHKKLVLERVRSADRVDSKYEMAMPPMYLDWRPGNVCNLKCRMCGPENSSQIYNEWSEFNKEGPEFEAWYRKFRPKATRNSGWYENENVWKNLEEWLPSLRKIYLTGGEPTLIKANWKLLDKARDKGLAKNIELQISMNLSRLPERLQENVECFKHTSLNLSIDGMGAAVEYIRGGSEWKVIEKNLKEIINWNPKKIEVWITPVVQIYNVFHLPEFIHWILQLRDVGKSHVNIDLLMSEGQPFNSIEILPESVKNQALPAWEALFKNPEFEGCGPKLRQKTELVMKALKSTTEPHHEKLMRDFWFYTDKLDEKRGQALKKSLPKLYQAIAHTRTTTTPVTLNPDFNADLTFN